MAYKITSRENDNVKRVCKLISSGALRRENSEFVAQGIKLCKDTAKVCLVKEVFYTQKAMDKYPEIANFSGIHYEISDSVADKISDVKTPQGIICVFEMPKFNSEDIDVNGRYIALDKVQDSGNVGAILRSAVGFGFDGVIISSDSADPFSPKTYRASMTGSVKIPVYITSNMANTIKELGDKNMLTVATRLEDSSPLDTLEKRDGVVLVVGNEGQGVSEDVANACKKSVRIPMSENIESLNASVAASILLWEYRKV